MNLFDFMLQPVIGEATEDEVIGDQPIIPFMPTEWDEQISYIETWEYHHYA